MENLANVEFGNAASAVLISLLKILVNKNILSNVEARCFDQSG